MWILDSEMGIIVLPVALAELRFNKLLTTHTKA